MIKICISFHFCAKGLLCAIQVSSVASLVRLTVESTKTVAESVAAQTVAESVSTQSVAESVGTVETVGSVSVESAVVAAAFSGLLLLLLAALLSHRLGYRQHAEQSQNQSHALSNRTPIVEIIRTVT